jgi:hypothetical protein
VERVYQGGSLMGRGLGLCKAVTVDDYAEDVRPDISIATD